MDESKIKLVLMMYKKQYENMDLLRMCKVFATNIHDSLNKVGVKNEIINLKEEFDLYDHEIILCTVNDYSKKRYILIDFTFSQFFPQFCDNSVYKQNSSFFNKLIENGYVEIDNKSMIIYLTFFGKIDIDMMTENLFNKIGNGSTL